MVLKKHAICNKIRLWFVIGPFFMCRFTTLYLHLIIDGSLLLQSHNENRINISKQIVYKVLQFVSQRSIALQS